MKKNIYFIRTAPYDYLIKGSNLYKSFDIVATLKNEVSLNVMSSDFFKLNVPKEVYKKSSIYCSPRKRSIQTAKLLGILPKTRPFLSEVLYSMENFISEKDFFGEDGKPNVNNARTGFVNALVNNELEESFDHVLERAEKILELVSKDKTQDIVIITHGFFLKIIEAYIRNPSIKKDPQQLLRYFDGKSETFHFCEGFTALYKEGNLIFDMYIRNKKGVK